MKTQRKIDHCFDYKVKQHLARLYKLITAKYKCVMINDQCQCVHFTLNQ